MKIVNGLLNTDLVSAADGVTAVKLDTTGPLTPEEIKALAKKLDDLIKFKSKIAEVFDGAAFRIALTAINDHGLAHLPKEVQDIFADILRDLLAVAVTE